MHTLIAGGTGSGKTVCLEGLARQAIRNKSPLIFLDPKGTVYHRLVKYCYKRNLTDRLYLIDPNDDRYRVGLNYFDLATASTAKKVGLVIEAIYRAMGSQDSDLTITFNRWGGAALSLLAEAGLSLADFYDVLQDEDFRQAALDRTDNPFVHTEWAAFERTPPREKAMYLQASTNRAAVFTQEQAIHEMLGQPNAIDWQDVMNNAGVVLVNLAPVKATEQVCRFLGIMLIHQIYHAGLERPKKFWKTPCYVIADEFADMVCSDFKDALQKLREFGVAMILALQNIGDLRGIDPNNPDAMLNSVLQNTETKFVLKTRNYDEAVFLGRNIFGPQITGMEVKDTHTSAIPRVFEKEVTTYSEAASEGHTSGEYSSESDGYSTSQGESHTDGHGASEVLTADELLLSSGPVSSRGTSESHVDSSGSSFSMASSSSSGTSVLDSWSRSSGTTKSIQQWTQYDYEQVRNYRSLEESFHISAMKLAHQEPGEGYLQFSTKRPALRIRTELHKEAFAREPALLDFTASIFERMGALPPAEARLIIENRRQGLLGAGRIEPTPLRPEHRLPADFEVGEDTDDGPN